MITLYGFGHGLGMYDPSPFVLKVACFLKMCELPFEFKGNVNNLGKAPKKKLPFIQDGEQCIADSSFINEYIMSTYAPDFDAHLSAEQRATALMVSKAMEEQFYWCIVYSRWVDSANWPAVKQALFGRLPWPLCHLIPVIARNGIKKQAFAQGTARHSKEEVWHIAKQMLDAVSALIGNNAYCFGDKPSSVDATLYAFLAEVISIELDSPLTELARSYENLVNYCQRMESQYFSDNN